MKTFDVNVKYTFEGTVTVRAKNRSMAQLIANNDFGVVLSKPSTSNSSNAENEIGVVDWDLKIHPTKSIVR